MDVHAIGQGVGFLSGRARVTLTYDQAEEGAPASVVVKLPTNIKAGADFAESTHAYEREIRFYREVAPRTPIRVPRMFATIMEPADKVFILVMEDLKGLTVGDQVAGMSRAQGGAEENESAFLSNPAERLVALDHVSHGKTAADINPQTGRINVITPNSRARNNDNRGNNINTGDILFDQILFPALLTPLYVNDSFRIFDAGVAIEGTGGQDGDQASDHLPVYADFVFGDTGGGDGGGEMPIVGVRIASLLANPEGVDEGKESITLINQATTTIDLSGWKLRDRAGGEAPLSGQLAPDGSTTVILPRSLALSNSGDEVALIGADGIERHRVSYTRGQVSPGEEIRF